MTPVPLGRSSDEPTGAKSPIFRAEPRDKFPITRAELAQLYFLFGGQAYLAKPGEYQMFSAAVKNDRTPRHQRNTPAGRLCHSLGTNLGTGLASSLAADVVSETYLPPPPRSAVIEAWLAVRNALGAEGIALSSRRSGRESDCQLPLSGPLRRDGRVSRKNNLSGLMELSEVVTSDRAESLLGFEKRLLAFPSLYQTLGSGWKSRNCRGRWSRQKSSRLAGLREAANASASRSLVEARGWVEPSEVLTPGRAGAYEVM
ncbi:hypothetical protein Bbelb_007820 [Branchiostoma belcheri]|nr:hypothetical protein Bbelb_007820 [Branchiostoma belcheri]